MKRILVIPLAVMGLCAIIGLLIGASHSNTCRASDISNNRIIELTNQNRTSPVVEDKLLDKAAQAKADDMAARGYFAHIYQGKTGWDFIKQANYKYWVAGENLGVDFYDSESLVQAWMNSPSHKRNVIDPRFKHIGIGIADGMFQGHRTKFVVEFFSN